MRWLHLQEVRHWNWKSKRGDPRLGLARWISSWIPKLAQNQKAGMEDCTHLSPTPCTPPHNWQDPPSILLPSGVPLESEYPTSQNAEKNQHTTAILRLPVNYSPGPGTWWATPPSEITGQGGRHLFSLLPHVLSGWKLQPLDLSIISQDQFAGASYCFSIMSGPWASTIKQALLGSY